MEYLPDNGSERNSGIYILKPSQERWRRQFLGKCGGGGYTTGNTNYKSGKICVSSSTRRFQYVNP